LVQEYERKFLQVREAFELREAENSAKTDQLKKRLL